MSGIGKKGYEKTTSDNKSLEQLKKEFDEIMAKIRTLIGARKDKNQMTPEEKRTLRTEYNNAAKIAKKIYERAENDDALEEKYKDLHKRCLDKAESYGSIMKREAPKTTMEDIKGQEDVKNLIKSFAFMADNPDILKYYKIQGGLGLLMYGAPGTGKTMFAEAIANKMQLPLFVVTPADIFKSYVGESEQAVKQLFQDIESCEEGAILFVDECESIFSKRTNDTKDYKAAVTTELLQRMNGFGVDGSKRILIGATNRPDQIDPAYLRYKRFSHMVHITPPDATARRSIVESKLNGIPLADDVTIDDIMFMMSKAQSTYVDDYGKMAGGGSYSSADICGIIEEACRLALEKLMEKNSTTPIPVGREMFEKAIAKNPPSISREVLETYNKFRESINDK
ncbi:MAG: ATP-binding protein [Clostridia bacterium]|nr:ATP-binding protein [Clostridia bacterium]